MGEEGVTETQGTPGQESITGTAPPAPQNPPVVTPAPAPAPAIRSDKEARDRTDELIELIERGRSEDKQHRDALQARLDEFYNWAKSSEETPTIVQPPVIVSGDPPVTPSVETPTVVPASEGTPVKKSLFSRIW